MVLDFKETQILNVCDNLRDNVLPDIGVLIEDLGKFDLKKKLKFQYFLIGFRAANRTVVKLCDRETLIKEREQKILVI